MRIEDFQRLATLVGQPLLLLSPAGTILASSPAAFRLGPGLEAGQRLEAALADPGWLREQLPKWLRLGGPVPARLDLRQGDEAVRYRALVGRADVDGSPAVLLCLSSVGDRFAQVTDELLTLQRENRHRREIEAHQQAALEAERSSRARLERLQALTAALAAAVTVDDTAEAILTHAPRVINAAEVALVLPDDQGRVRLRAADSFAVGLVARDRTLDQTEQPLRAVLGGSGSMYFGHPAELLDAYPALRAAGARVDSTRFLAAALPLIAGPGEPPVGGLGFIVDGSDGLSAERRVSAGIIAAQCAQALERARLYDAERRFAETLQRALLPGRLPRTEGVECAVRYLPAAELRAVGGDWYAVFALSGGRVGLAVGDVAGHGPAAATAMGTMRSALRALATTDDSPAEVLAAFNRFVCAQLPEEMATVAFLVADLGAGTLTYANAGHLPPLVIGAGPDPFYLDDVLQPPVGVSADIRYQEATWPLEDRCQLVMYTDGLVERRGEGIDRGLTRLRRAAFAQKASPGDLCDHLLEVLVGDEQLRDDAALLVANIAHERGAARPAGCDRGEYRSVSPPRGVRASGRTSHAPGTPRSEPPIDRVRSRRPRPGARPSTPITTRGLAPTEATPRPRRILRDRRVGR